MKYHPPKLLRDYCTKRRCCQRRVSRDFNTGRISTVDVEDQAETSRDAISGDEGDMEGDINNSFLKKF